MSTQIITELTPNPNSVKFITPKKVINAGHVSYKKGSDTSSNAIAKAIFAASEAVTELYFFDNYITVTQDGTGEWPTLDAQIKEVVGAGIESHDANIESNVDKAASGSDLDKINAVIDATIRPTLLMHGGNLDILAYNNNTLTINYQGACGSCPSAKYGTLQAIEAVLRRDFNPDIIVQMA